MARVRPRFLMRDRNGKSRGLRSGWSSLNLDARAVATGFTESYQLINPLASFRPSARRSASHQNRLSRPSNANGITRGRSHDHEYHRPSGVDVHSQRLHSTRARIRHYAGRQSCNPLVSRRLAALCISTTRQVRCGT
jgi:hypothetical protein